MKQQSKTIGIVGIAIMVLLLALFIALTTLSVTANSFITMWWSSFSETGNSVLDEDFTWDTAVANTRDVSVRTMEEGAVLLRNRDNTLPLAKNSKVNLFGYYSVNSVLGSGGSSTVGSASYKTVTMKEGLEAAGLTVNPELYTWQAEQEGDDRVENIFTMEMDYAIKEFKYADYTSAGLIDKAKNYSDVAIYVLARNAGEKQDPTSEYGKNAEGKEGDGYHYLQITDLERNMIRGLTENFSKVIVLCNNATMMELGVLEEFDVEAAMFIGTLGSYGATGVGKLLVEGGTNPSGHLYATYSYDVTDNPAFYTYGDNVYANASEWSDLKDYACENVTSLDTNYNKYYHYYEGIYVGYRYYETRYIGTDNVYTAEEEAEYRKHVQYPFGYGMSYTDFTWSNPVWTIGNQGGTISVSVDVKNNGTIAGRDAVQLYYTAPYTAGGIEKSAVNLGGYAKTPLIAGGATETVTITMNFDDMASYDYKTAKAYVLDAGKYVLSLRSDAHTVKDGLAKEFTLDNKIIYDDEHDGKRSTDKIAAKNQFDELNEGDGSITYVSRADFEGTLPTVRDEDKSISLSAKLVARIKDAVHGSYVDGPDKDAAKTAELGLTEFTFQAENGLTVADFAGKTDFDDPAWDRLLDQLSITDMQTFYSDGAYRVASCAAIGMERTVDADGPTGLNATSIGTYGDKVPAPAIWASTFNDALIEELGKCLGDEWLLAGAVGMYGPAVNIMRTAFNGRNGEYISECPILTGKINAAYTRGAQGEGCYVYMKHYAVYGCAGNASAMTWVNEQALREIWLRHFEMGVKEANAMGMMVSFSKIGTSLNTCSYNLLTALPRDEWGFMGAFVSDGIGTASWDQNLGLRAGLNLVLDANVDSQMTSFKDATVTKSVYGNVYGQYLLRQNAKWLIYRYCNSAASTSIRDYTPTWIVFIVILDVIFVAGIVCCFIFLVRPAFFPKKNKE